MRSCTRRRVHCERWHAMERVEMFLGLSADKSAQQLAAGWRLT